MYKMKFCPLTRKLCDKLTVAGTTRICEADELPIDYMEECPKK